MSTDESPLITVITPTTGRESLAKLRDSLKQQKASYTHLLLWDATRDETARTPDSYKNEVTNSICLPGRMVQGDATGSALRAVGLMAATTRYVTFADDDVWFEKDHFSLLLDAIESYNWAYSMRKIYSPSGDYIGVDRFESIGDESALPYDLVDNSSNMFLRQIGVAAAHLYRETTDYNDDRLMYNFLKRYAGAPAKTNTPTVNQACPDRLETFFRTNCSSE